MRDTKAQALVFASVRLEGRVVVHDASRWLRRISLREVCKFILPEEDLLVLVRWRFIGWREM